MFSRRVFGLQSLGKPIVGVLRELGYVEREKQIVKKKQIKKKECYYL